MERIINFFRFNKPSKIVLDRDEKKEFSMLAQQDFGRLDEKDKERVLELAAKDFTGKFSKVIQELSRE